MDITKNNGDTSFPDILRLLRKNKDWSQGQLAQKAGIDLQKISKYERGISSPPIGTLVKIAKALDVSLDYLITGKSARAEKLKNTQLIERIEEIERLPVEYQKTLISVLDSFIKRHRFEELAQR
ncbi:helix-turn-helix domain-containing protein [Desulfosarcina sp. OttesenSCG-928-G10]|nr:helix-turn-helix domain-containing protein [Desulfosarcina sp. OttesenSCG-928-G10]